VTQLYIFTTVMGKRQGSRSPSRRRHKRHHRHRSQSAEVEELKKSVNDLKSSVAQLCDIVKSNSQSARRSVPIVSSGAQSQNNDAISISSSVSGDFHHQGLSHRDKLNCSDSLTGVTDQKSEGSRNFGEDRQKSEERESTLDEETLALLGSAPRTDRSFGANLHKEVALRWEDALDNGLNKLEMSKFKEMYLIPENWKVLQAPELNPEVEAVSSEFCLERDKQFISFQDNIAHALAALGSGITLGLNLPNAIQKDVRPIIGAVSSASQLLLDVQREISLHRRELVTPKQGTLQTVASSTKPGISLFGNDLRETIKTVEELNKLGQSMVKSSGAPASKKPADKKVIKKPSSLAKPLNYRRPLSYTRSRYNSSNRKQSGHNYRRR